MILLLKSEAERISKKTSMNIDEFAEEVNGHDPYVYVMKKLRDGKCVFLGGKTCKIYSIRPLVCRFYPFELEDCGNRRYVFRYTKECPSIGKGPMLRKHYFFGLFGKLERALKKRSVE